MTMFKRKTKSEKGKIDAQRHPERSEGSHALRKSVIC